MRAPPPLPKIGSSWPQLEHTWVLMFSTMPSTGTLTFWNIRRPLRASSSAMSCGVVTTTAPLTGTRCDSVSWMSPVPGRHVDDQVVELAPVGVVEQLLQGLRDHRAAPDHGLLFLDQEADRHDLDAVRLERLHALAVVADRPFALQAHHAGLAGPVDVGVEQADPGAVERQGQGQVDRRRGLADAALARGHRNDVADAGQRLQLALGDVGRDLPADRHRGVPEPGSLAQERLQFGGQRPGVAPGREAQLDLHQRAGRPRNRTDFTALAAPRGIPR